MAMNLLSPPRTNYEITPRSSSVLPSIIPAPSTRIIKPPSDNSISSFGVNKFQNMDFIENNIEIPEDIKWNEYLQSPFLLNNPIQNQTHFATEDSVSAANWHSNQLQQPLQSAEIYRKHFQMLPASFGQFS
ncbi:transcription factor MYB [Forsythia ovata]|uniref:Transcription factor MYB n=1 Tax=Forsythia ovata TaxID=205694 RepID=A0ABD1TMF6_9LAMI